MLDNSGMRALPLEGEQWYEIDDIQDLDIAESIFTERQYDLLADAVRSGLDMEFIYRVLNREV